MGILDDEFGGGGTIPTNPTPRPKPRPPYTPPDQIPPSLPDTPDLIPGKPDIGLEEYPELDETSPNAIQQEDDSFQLTDDQRFMLIGLVVLGGLFGFIKK
tara:strand:- start:327 stop:626 length:300 start_codon:yes stop_codon:yes gene_type:complete